MDKVLKNRPEITAIFNFFSIGMIVLTTIFSEVTATLHVEFI